jgi:predicted lactoylglutathione lyase
MFRVKPNATMKNTIINPTNEPNASNMANAAAAARRESRTMRARPNLTISNTNNHLAFNEKQLNLKPYLNAAKTLRQKVRNNKNRLKGIRNETKRMVKNQQKKIKKQEEEKRALNLKVPFNNIKEQNKFFKMINQKKVKMAAEEEARLKGMEEGIKAMQIKHVHNLEVEKQRWADPKKYREWLNDNKIIVTYMDEVYHFDKKIITKQEATSIYYKIKYTDDDEHRTIRSLLKESGSLRRAIRYYEQSYKRGPYVY